MSLLIAQKDHILSGPLWEQHWASRKPQGTRKRREEGTEDQRAVGGNTELSSAAARCGVDKWNKRDSWESTAWRTLAGTDQTRQDDAGKRGESDEKEGWKGPLLGTG